MTVAKRTSFGPNSGAVSVVGVVSAATVLCVTEDDGLIGCPSITEDRLRFGLATGQYNSLTHSSGFQDLHMRLPPVYVTSYAVFDAIAARQPLRSCIAAHLSVMTCNTGNGRALPLSFDCNLVHTYDFGPDTILAGLMLSGSKYIGERSQILLLPKRDVEVNSKVWVNEGKRLGLETLYRTTSPPLPRSDKTPDSRSPSTEGLEFAWTS